MKKIYAAFRRVALSLGYLHKHPQMPIFSSGELPPEFCSKTYRSLYKDVAHFSEGKLRNHYFATGRREGRRAYPFSSRLEFAQQFPVNKSVLEISPFTSPFFIGPNVEYADVLDQDALRHRALSLSLDPDDIPKISYVISPTSPSSTVGKKFDIIASSHVIEHQPNLLGHLREISMLLKQFGQYALVIPDKRYCFDHFISETTVAQLLQADLENRSTHSLSSVIEHAALTTHNDPARHWAGDHGDPVVVLDKVKKATQEYQDADGDYIDVHSCYFSPDSFVNLIDLTRDLSFHNFRVQAIYPTERNNLEFYVVLQRMD